MDKKELEQYCKLKKEIGYLRNRLDRLYGRDIPVVAGKVQASERFYPCIRKHVSVQMYEPAANDKLNEAIAILEERQRRCSEKMLEVERYIDGIGDSELRQIFGMRYIEGMKLREIADKVNLDLSVVSKKITSYIEFANNAKKSVL